MFLANHHRHLNPRLHQNLLAFHQLFHVTRSLKLHLLISLSCFQVEFRFIYCSITQELLKVNCYGIYYDTILPK